MLSDGALPDEQPHYGIRERIARTDTVAHEAKLVAEIVSRN